MRVLFACDRSGGHIFPALCLARFLAKENVCFFAPSPYFKSLLKEDNWLVYGFPLKFRNIVTEAFFRFWEALYVIFKFRPQRVVGFGGRDTFFLIIWARIFLINAFLYEPNFVMGKANKILSLFTKAIYCGFPKKTRLKNVKRVGIPIRENLKILDKNESRKKLGLDMNLPVVLCFGGSQGSEFINNIFKRLAETFKKDFQIIHITGFKQYADFLKFYDKINKKARVYDFCRNMEEAYSSADLVISRSGALSLAEISFYHIPAILIPYPDAGAHQYENARYAQDKKACRVFLQNGFSLNEFKDNLESLLDNQKLRQSLSDNIKNLDLAVSCREFYNNFNL